MLQRRDCNPLVPRSNTLMCRKTLIIYQNGDFGGFPEKWGFFGKSPITPQTRSYPHPQNFPNYFSGIKPQIKPKVEAIPIPENPPKFFIIPVPVPVPPTKIQGRLGIGAPFPHAMLNVKNPVTLCPTRDGVFFPANGVNKTKDWAFVQNMALVGVEVSLG